jgi:hypothetical protein
VFADLLPAVLEAEANLGCSWRQVVAVVASFPSIAKHVSNEEVRAKASPLAYSHFRSAASTTHGQLSAAK